MTLEELATLKPGDKIITVPSLDDPRLIINNEGVYTESGNWDKEVREDSINLNRVYIVIDVSLENQCIRVKGYKGGALSYHRFLLMNQKTLPSNFIGKDKVFGRRR